MDVKDFKSRDIVFWGQLNGEDIMEVAGEQLKMVIEKQFRVKVQPRGKVNRGVIDVARELLSKAGAEAEQGRLSTAPALPPSPATPHSPSSPQSFSCINSPPHRILFLYQHFSDINTSPVLPLHLYFISAASPPPPAVQQMNVNILVLLG